MVAKLLTLQHIYIGGEQFVRVCVDFLCFGGWLASEAGTMLHFGVFAGKPCMICPFRRAFEFPAMASRNPMFML